MATIVRQGRLRIVVYSRDHPPPHVHVIAPEGNAKVIVDGPIGRPALIWNLGLSRRDIGWALAEIAARRDLIVHEWRRIHGYSSVGPD